MSIKNNTPNGQLYIGFVKWNKSNNNVMLFNSKEERNNFFINNFTLLTSDIIAFNPNGQIKINKNIANIEEYNYIFYRNDSDISNTFFCCYIDDWSITAQSVTILNISLDVFQTYIYDVTFSKSYIERGHVANDSIGKWLAPEPINIKPQYEKKIGIFNGLDWSPQWVLHSTSIKNNNNYVYSGRGSGETLTTEYGIFVKNATEIQEVIKDYGRKSMDEILTDIGSSVSWKDLLNSFLSGGTSISSYNAILGLQNTTSIADLQDHRNELIGLYAIPKWLVDTPEQKYAKQSIKTVTDDITLDTTQLACGYVPKNKKMLTSLCKGYVLYNENGFKKTFLPELFTSDKISLQCTGSQMAINGYSMYISNYANFSDSYNRIAYSCQSRIGYDANTGLDKSLNIIQASLNAVNSVAGVATTGMITPSGVGNIINKGVSLVDALGQRGVSTGASGDIISISGTRPIPQLVDVSPTYEECQIVDDYLSAYGYSIEEISNPINWLNTRPNYNYIKTNDIILNFKACNRFIEEMANIFNNGIRIWHNYNVFGNLEVDNNVE